MHHRMFSEIGSPKSPSGYRIEPLNMERHGSPSPLAQKSFHTLIMCHHQGQEFSPVRCLRFWRSSLFWVLSLTPAATMCPADGVLHPALAVYPRPLSRPFQTAEHLRSIPPIIASKMHLGLNFYLCRLVELFTG